MFSMRLVSLAMIAGLVFAGCGKSGGAGKAVKQVGTAIEKVGTAIEKGDALDDVLDAVAIPKEVEKAAENAKPFLQKAKDFIAALWAKLPVAGK
jgi:predicted small secreted protein